MGLLAYMRKKREERDALTVGQVAQLLQCPKQIVFNLVELGRLTPLDTDPMLFSPEEARQGKERYDERRKALDGIIRLGEGLE